MRNGFRWSCLVIGTALWAFVAAGRGSAGAEPAATYDLAKVEGLKQFEGSAAAGRLLARNGFVVTGKQFKQVFSAYIGGELPKFITTDSAWHTYHVLLEEGVKQLEETQAKRLRAFSRALREAARRRGKAGQAGFEDLAAYASIGLAFQDAGHLKSLARQRAAIVQALRAGELPVKVHIGFDLMPQRFRAKSFYTKSSDLSDYFAARQWYAIVDFRLRDRRETALAVKLAILIDGNAELSKLWRQLSEPYDVLLAPCEDGSVASYAAVAKKVLGGGVSPPAIDRNIEAIRKDLARRLADPKVNDQLLLPEQYVRFAEEIKGFRLLPPRRLPSAACFQNTVDPKIKERMFPSGLDFLAACKPLRSPAAKRALEGQFGKPTAQAVLQADCGKLPDSLHGQAFKLLAVLQEPPPRTAPAPLRTPAWADKQLWTQLGAWAEQRHTWALHTKLTVLYLSAAPEPAGVVSPYPEFFAGLARLARATAKALDSAGVGKSFDVQAAAKDLLEHLEIYYSLIGSMRTARPRTAEEREKFRAKAVKVDRVFHFLHRYARELREKTPGDKDPEAALAKLARTCAASGKATQEQTRILKMFAYTTGEVGALLGGFAGLCDSLAGLARKQLAGEKPTKEDEGFIRNYGEALARSHFYGGNSWLSPRDDFPLATPIFVSPMRNRDAILYAGLSRPQALYVIAPANGKLHLFRGAVMTYREFRRPITQPLDDEAWRALIKKGPVPPPPPFTKSFLDDTPLPRPKGTTD